MAKIVTDLRELEAALAGLPAHVLIAIDGWNGVGKTTAARALAPALGRACIDLDEFLGEPSGAFVSNLDLEGLQAAFAFSIPAIVSGVCLRDVFDLIGAPPARHVYIKRMAKWGWADQEEAEGLGGDYVVIDAAVPPPPLMVEVREYHWRVKPQDRADVVFERPDDR